MQLLKSGTRHVVQEKEKSRRKEYSENYLLTYKRKFADYVLRRDTKYFI